MVRRLGDDEYVYAYVYVYDFDLERREDSVVHLWTQPDEVDADGGG